MGNAQKKARQNNPTRSRRNSGNQKGPRKHNSALVQINPARESFTTDVEVLPDYFGWREGACAKFEPNDENVKFNPLSLAQHVITTLNEVESYLLSEKSTNKSLPPLEVTHQAPDADWSSFSHSILARVRACNKLPGPRMRVVWGMTLAKLGRLPRWPNDHEHVLDAEALLEAHIARMDAKGKIDGRIPGFSFFSHRWLRPSLDLKRAHPDSGHNDKAKVLAEYCAGGTCPIFAEHTFDYYYWIDFCGIDQDDPVDKALSICKMPCYVTSCVETIFYHSAKHSYEPRVWTRFERMISYAYTIFPLFVYLDEEYPKKPISIKELVDKETSIFFQDPESGSLHLRINDPLGEDACLTDEGDLELIQKLMDVVEKTVPLNPHAKMKLKEPAAITFDDYITVGKTMICVDTEHYTIDNKAGERLTNALAKFCPPRLKMSL